MHNQEGEKHFAKWLKLGVIPPTKSSINSSIFAIAKKNGGIQLVQDFRALNTHTLTNKYSMKDVGECINNIGPSGSMIFTTINLTARFWQLLLHQMALRYPAFTVPNLW